jgi:sugar-phosphatase
MDTRAVIFDLDGLLIDSEPHWRAVEREVFARAGLALTDDDCAATTGLRIDEVVALRMASPAWRGPPRRDTVEAIVEGVVARIAAHGVPKAGAIAAVRRIRSLGLPVALASSSPMRVIDAALHRLEARGLFDVIQSAEHLPLGKPHPEVYLRTAQRLGVEAPRCVAVEDSVLGMIAAKAARMRCVVVPERPDPRFALADRVLETLDALDGPALE